ncbi:PTS sugar transporter subunit IIA [Pararhizobium sp.]|uniref:PTS sugar transporter subunit IIA n=1 Tax=Pararhizobium sp. TaxID=1977563 RepID=UPI003D0CE4C6
MLSPLLSEEDIVLDLAAKGKRSALSAIAARIARRSGVDDQVVLSGLLYREKLGSTGVGRGIAMPHALLDEISSPIASLTRLAHPVDFHGPDNDPVDLLYALIWPRSAISAFLPAFSKMCRLLWLPEVREKLRQARSTYEVMLILDAEQRPAMSSSSRPVTVGRAR